MRRLVIVSVSTVLALAAWTALVLVGTLGGWGRATLAPRGDVGAFMSAATQKITADSKGNAAFALIEGGRVHGEHFSSTGRPVDRDTLFQVASLSKWITAWGVMTLVESGRIDLDAPVSRYLTRWTLPPSAFDNDGVTVRRLLSHTAGLTDGLGYAGFAPGAEMQTLEQSLTRAADPSPGADGVVRVGAAPGGEWKYSGGGYTLLQLIIEEASGDPFQAYMQRAVFQPLGMSRSTFELPEDGGANVAEFFDKDGSRATHYQFTAKAAASLYTSTADLTRFIQAHLAGPGSEPPGRGVLRPETLAEMRRPHAFQYGGEIWGLGVILYAPNNADDFIVGHDGSNAPAINTTARFDPATGDGIVVLETGNAFLATKLAGEWVFWQTGNLDLFEVTAALPRALLILAVGCLLILVAAVLAAWRWRSRAARVTA
jgi:CubicO group peptidase (beta-lactamase class C family)